MNFYELESQFQQLYSYFVQDVPQQPQRKMVLWLKRLGVAGFLFFLIKGLLWLIVPGLLAYFTLS